jgi:hypothetical protein
MHVVQNIYMFCAVKLIRYTERHFHFEYQNVILFYVLFVYYSGPPL